jgi:hypothetical protein
MKRKGPTFGHSQVNYRLGNIFKRVIKEFHEADGEREKIDDEYENKVREADAAREKTDVGHENIKKQIESANLLPELFSLQERRMEIGVILLMTAGAFLEQIINDYANTFLDSDSYEEHLDNLRSVSKWIVLPRLCQNKEISEDDPAIKDFREFVKARNAIVHHKRRDFDLNLHKTSNQTSIESARFLSACRKAESTVDGLIKILTSQPPGAEKPKPADDCIRPKAK